MKPPPGLGSARGLCGVCANTRSFRKAKDRGCTCTGAAKTWAGWGALVSWGMEVGSLLDLGVSKVQGSEGGGPLEPWGWRREFPLYGMMEEGGVSTALLGAGNGVSVVVGDEGGGLCCT